MENQLGMNPLLAGAFPVFFSLRQGMTKKQGGFFYSFHFLLSLYAIL
jgi:hypothetical protein